MKNIYTIISTHSDVSFMLKQRLTGQVCSSLVGMATERRCEKCGKQNESTGRPGSSEWRLSLIMALGLGLSEVW